MFLSSLCLLFQGVSRLLVSRPIPFLTLKYLIFTPKSHATLVSTCSTVRSAQQGRQGGVPWVAWRYHWPRTCFWTGMQFNLPTRFLIPDPSLDTVPAGDWGAELRGLYVNRTLQRRSRFEHLPIPVLAKVVITFSLP